MAEKDREGDIDRISDLPDSVLCHILSFLPTKTSVCTMSLVSRRWSHLWKYLQVFNFSGNYYHEDDINLAKKFAFFVNAVLTLRRSRDILKMHLDCCLMEEGDFSLIDFIDLWVCAAIGPRLEELDLMLTGMCEIGVVLPATLLNCSNLVSLSLSGRIYLKNEQCSWSQVHFPSLKNLCLQVDYVDSIDALLSGCPILVTLNITDASESSRFSVPPSLKSLQYENFGIFSSTYIIDIDAPCLEYLRINTYGACYAVVGNLQNVVEAYINVNNSVCYNSLLDLLCAISETKHLTLLSSSTKLVLCAPISDFPVFRSLLHLNLHLPCFNLKLLATLLENCHVLQDFVILNDKVALPPQIWEPESTRIPNCLVSHLTSIRIIGYGGFKEELTFVEYILRNALVLKTMVIKSDVSLRLKEKLTISILKKLINIPKGSHLCQVKFD